MWIDNCDPDFPVIHLDESEVGNYGEKVTLTVEIDKDLKKMVKSLAVLNNDSLTRIVEKAFKSYVKRNKKNTITNC